MKTTNNIWQERKDFKNYLDQINWDGLFLKVQLIFVGGIILALFGYFLLFR